MTTDKLLAGLSSRKMSFLLSKMNDDLEVAHPLVVVLHLPDSWSNWI